MPRVVVVVLALLLTPACTIVYQQVGPVDGSTGDDGPSSWPTLPESSDSSTGELVGEDSTTGAGDTSTGEGVDTTTGSTGLDSSGGAETTGDEGNTSGSEAMGDTSTSGSSSTSTNGDESTTEPLPPGKALGEDCSMDADCESGVCIGGGFDDIHRCSTPCEIDTADSCKAQGHPGLCLYGGGDARWCAGSFDLAGLEKGAPFFQTNKLLAGPDMRHAYLVPPTANPFYIETATVNDPGYGPVLVDLFDSSGHLVGTYESGANPVVEPSGVNGWHWLILRPDDGAQKSHYSMWLKDT